MAKKTWKIGEYTIGGIISVEIKNKNVHIQCLDWNTKESVRSCWFLYDQTSEMDENLHDMTSSYYAGQIMEWIRSQIPQTVSI
jgi:hypothetical protein